MSDVEVTYTQSLTREETARWLSTLAAALADEGEVDLQLGPTRMKVRVPVDVYGKIEVEIDHDEVEFEVELTWSTAAPVRSPVPVQQAVSAPTDGKPASNRQAARRKVDAQ